MGIGSRLREAPGGLAHAIQRGRGWRRPPAEPVGETQMLRPRAGARLHLGSGDVHLRGYLNVDLPSGPGRRPDLEADLLGLRCPVGVIAEVRLHHVFEHLDRIDALALLLRWREWLRVGGRITIETPDFERCAELYLSSDLEQRMRILRHVFGSHEAPWAVHRDGWARDRFAHVLGELGYAEISFVDGASDEQGLLPNLTVTATKANDTTPLAVRLEAARRILELSLNGRGPSELEILETWRSRLEARVTDLR